MGLYRATLYLIVDQVLNNNSFETISITSAKGDARKFWSIGDTKKVNIDNIIYNIRIIGFDHDTANSITFEFSECFPETVSANDTNTNIGGYFNSNLATVADSYRQKFSNLSRYVRRVYKDASIGNQSATIYSKQVYYFFLAEIEVAGTTNYSFAGEGSEYSYYVAGNSRIKYVGGSSSTKAYWHLRSPRKQTSDAFCQVMGNGNVGFNGAGVKAWVSLAFVI